jgi:hypothetical protein
MVIAMSRLKKQVSVIFMLGLAICTYLSACAAESGGEMYEKTTVSEVYLANYTENGMGDHAGDSAAASREDRVCYRKLTYDHDGWTGQVENVKNALYRMSAGGAEKIKLAESDNENDFCDITVAGDWIYYVSDYVNLCRMRTDGTEQVVLDENTEKLYNVVVEDGWIYYLNKRHDLLTRVLYRIRVDGTDRTKLMVIDDVKDFTNIIGDWIYCVAGDWIYYASGNTLCKIRTDGTEDTVLNKNDGFGDGSIYCICVSGDWIYYHSGDYLYKIRTDGSDKTILDDDDSGSYEVNRGVSSGFKSMEVAGDWIYYIRVLPAPFPFTFSSANSNRMNFIFPLYKIRTDGTERVKLSDDYIDDICIAEDWIYYTGSEEEDEPQHLYMIRPDGTERQSVE